MTDYMKLECCKLCVKEAPKQKWEFHCGCTRGECNCTYGGDLPADDNKSLG
jgi:hypothetical protein